MGDEPGRAAMTARVSWWLVDVLSRALEPGEREAVRGDLAEAGETTGRAVVQVLGLVLRRQAELWSDWRPWATLLLLILPLSLMLSLTSRRGAGASAVYFWLYVDNFYWGLLSNRGFWHVLLESAAHVSTIYITLACWAWAAGFVLGAVSRKMVGTNGALLCLTLVLGELFGVPLYFALLSEYMPWSLPGLRYINPSDPVSALTFYGVLFPLLVQAILVALPALSGMRRGAELEKHRPLLRAVLWMAAIATLGLMMLRETAFVLLLHWQIFGFDLNDWPVRLLRFFWGQRAAALIVYWPVAYIVASAIARRWHSRMGTSTQQPTVS